MRIEELRAEIKKGLESGEPTPLDVEAIKVRGRKRLAAEQKKATPLMPRVLKRPQAESDFEEIW